MTKKNQTVIWLCDLIAHQKPFYPNGKGLIMVQSERKLPPISANRRPGADP